MLPFVWSLEQQTTREREDRWGKKTANTGETKEEEEEEEEERSEGREREMSEEGEKRARLVIRELELENFKSYAGVQKVGPFHKVRCQKIARE